MISLLIVLFLTIFCFYSYFSGHRNSRHIVQILIYTMFIIIFSSRSNDIPDTIPYREMFLKGVNSFDNVEIGYLRLNDALRNIGLSFFQYLLIIELFLFITWEYTTKLHFSRTLLPFIIFMSYMGLYFYGIVLRAAIGTTICYLALSIMLKHINTYTLILYYLLVGLSMTIHQSMLVFLFVPFLCFKKYNNYLLYFIVAISAIIPIIGLDKYIGQYFSYFISYFNLDRFDSYVENGSQNNNTSYALTSIKYLLLSLTFIYCRKYIILNTTKYNFFLNIYILGFVLISNTYFITSGSRLAMCFLFFEFILVSFIYTYSVLNKKFTYLIIVVVIMINIIALYRGTPSIFLY